MQGFGFVVLVVRDAMQLTYELELELAGWARRPPVRPIRQTLGNGNGKWAYRSSYRACLWDCDMLDSSSSCSCIKAVWNLVSVPSVPSLQCSISSISPGFSQAFKVVVTLVEVVPIIASYSRHPFSHTFSIFNVRPVYLTRAQAVRSKTTRMSQTEMWGKAPIICQV